MYMQVCGHVHCERDHVPVARRESEVKQKHVNLKTTEELQMEEIQRLRKEAKRKLRQSRKSFRKLAKSSGPIAVKYSKKTTETLEFQFKTTGRDRTKVSEQQYSATVHPSQFAMMLRSTSKAENFHPNVVSCIHIYSLIPSPKYRRV